MEKRFLLALSSTRLYALLMVVTVWFSCSLSEERQLAVLSAQSKHAGTAVLA